MRPLVSIITIIATVIHFTFGCCTHSCHFGSGDDCHLHPIVAATGEACCDEDLHEDPQALPSGRQFQQTESGRGSLPGSDPCHDCAGCHCAARSTDTVTMAPWSPLMAPETAPISAAALPPSADNCGTAAVSRPIRPAPSRLIRFGRIQV